MEKFLGLAGLSDNEAKRLLTLAKLYFKVKDERLYIEVCFVNKIDKAILKAEGIEEIFAYPINLDETIIVVKIRLPETKDTYRAYRDHSLLAIEDIHVRIKSVIDDKMKLGSADTILIRQYNNSLGVHIDNLKFADKKIDQVKE